MKILITGPESSGKSTLAQNLAWAVDGIFVAEQARDYLHERNNHYGPADLPLIWKRQLHAEWQAFKTGASYIFCDTGPEVIRVWSAEKYGAVDANIIAATEEHHYDLVLLCSPDLPWTPDPQREHPAPADRLRLFSRYRELLPAATIIVGDHRTEQGLRAIFALHPRPRPQR